MAHSKLTPELRYLAAVVARGVRLRVTKEAVAPPLAPRVIDWARFADEAMRHNVVALACEGLEGCPIPPEPMARLRRVTQKLHVAMLLLTQELARVEQALTAAGVDVVAVKGPVLAHQLFGGVGFRASNDLDLLISAEDMLSAQQTLFDLGYQNDKPKRPLDARTFAYLRQSVMHHANFRNTTQQVAVELHWRLLGMHESISFVDDPSLLASLQSVEVSGRAFDTLNNDDLMLYLCVHGAKHMWLAMKWLADVAALVIADEIEWNSWCQRVETLGVRRSVTQGMVLIRDVMGVSLPPACETLVSAEKRSQKLADIVCREWLSQASDRNASQHNQLLYGLALRSKPGHKLKMFRRYWLDARHWPFWQLPKWLWYINYVVAPFNRAFKRLVKRV